MHPSIAEQQGFGKGERVTLDARVWFALRRQLLQHVLAFRTLEREAKRVLEQCRHVEGCEAVTDRARPCRHDCPDRETWLSALVVLHNAAQYGLVDKPLPYKVGAEYRPPGRETFDATVTELEVLRAGADVLAELEHRLGADTMPPPAGADEEAPVTRLLPPELELEQLDDHNDHDDEQENDEP